MKELRYAVCYHSAGNYIFIHILAQLCLLFQTLEEQLEELVGSHRVGPIILLTEKFKLALITGKQGSHPRLM